MRAWGKIVIVALLVSLVAIPALGWDLAIKGDAEWRYRYWTRTGDVDIFGPMDNAVYLGINQLNTFPTRGTQNGIETGTNNGPFGVVAGENCYGKEMSFVDYRMTLYPKIRVNPAIELDASVNLTSLGIWSDGQPYLAGAVTPIPTAPTDGAGYVNSLYVPIGNRPVATDVPNTFVTLQWLKLGIKTPMLDISTGYKSSHWGMGLWKHNFNRASSSFSVSTNYGPFLIGFSPYFARNESTWRTHGTSRNTGAGSYQRQEQRRNYFLALEGELVYKSGDLEIGLLSDSYVEHHANRVNARFARHGGHIAVDSDVGKGTTFTLYLPASEDCGREQRQAYGFIQEGKGRILVMGDEPTIRDVASQMLVSMGYEVGTSREGSEAISLYKRSKDGGEPFDAVIMDLTVPGGMGGKEAIEKLRHLDPKVKAIASSGYCNDPIMGNFQKYGFAGVLAKPYSVMEMNQMLYYFDSPIQQLTPTDSQFKK